MGLLAYLGAGALELSAILAAFFAGLTMSHYTWHSMGPAGQSLALYSFRILSGGEGLELISCCRVLAYTRMRALSCISCCRQHLTTFSTVLSKAYEENNKAGSFASLLQFCAVVRLLVMLATDATPM